MSEVMIDEIRKQVELVVGCIKENHVYSIYSCGHIVDIQDDPKLLFHFSNKTGKTRACHICRTAIPGMLVTKYRKCGCGIEYAGVRIQESQSCKSCYVRTIKDFNSQLLKTFRNGHLADENRWDCLSRAYCLIEYEKYDALPCLGCRHYAAGGLCIDDFAMAAAG